MTAAGRSVFVFGVYVFVVGISFLAAPAAMIGILQLPSATDGWIRTIGLLALVIGAYDMVGGRAGLLPYIRASVWVRFGFATGVALLVITREMPPTALPLGIIDVAGAIWTSMALKKAPAVAAA